MTNLGMTSLKAISMVAAIALLGLVPTFASADVTLPSRLVVSFPADPTAEVGQVVTFRINATNVSDITLHNVRAFVNLGQGVPANSLMFIAGASDARCTLANSVVECTQGDLPSHTVAGWNVALKVFPLPSATCGSTITQITDVSANESQTVWASHSLTISTCPTPTPTPTPTPSATPTPTPTREEKKGISVVKTDHKDITRPGHSLTYVISVKNEGNIDMEDVKITDNVPSYLTVTAIGNDGKLSGSTLTWTNVKVDAGATKQFTFKAVVKSNTPNNHVLTNTVKARSEDHDVQDEARDTTVVKREAQVAATVTPAVSVPVTAKTGAGTATALMATLSGAAGLVVTLRKQA